MEATLQKRFWYVRHLHLIRAFLLFKCVFFFHLGISTKQENEEWQDVYKKEHKKKHQFYPKYNRHSFRDLPDFFPPFNQFPSLIDINMERDRFMYNNYLTSRTPFFWKPFWGKVMLTSFFNCLLNTSFKKIQFSFL